MLQAQGLRPPDPYRTLQLHPLAPRALVADVYWALLEYAKAAGGAPRSARIAALDEAYALLADDGRRAAYDEANGLAGMPPLAEQRAGPATEDADFYEILRVDREADALVLGIAYRAMTRAGAGPGLDAARRRGLLDEAFRTLSNRELRAQYDLALARRHGARGEERTAAQDTRPPYLALVRAGPAPVPARVPEPLAARLRAPGPDGTPPTSTRPRGILGRLLGREHAPRDALTAEERRLLVLRGDAPAHRHGGRAPEP
ncbi:MAG: hypothetical protein KGK07_14235 [Chloroflexota bacterium]|nr:hypothetical protein [Chloroflexota bacterium]